ncbi:MAG: GNAT family N-acetyltransferase [Planctomycetes bacterium]|nr:GNAT family N-acetyltransferase [Planctomycetota bacterium]
MDAPVIVRILAEEPAAWWDEVALRARSIWHTRDFARLHRECGGTVRFLAAFRGATPTGVALLLLGGSRKLPLLDILFARVALVPDEPAAGDRESAIALLGGLLAEARRARAAEASVRVELPRFLDVPDLTERGLAARRRGIALIEVPPDPAAVERGMAAPARRQARKAARLGVRVEVADGVEPLLPLLDLSFLRSGLPPRDHGYVRALDRCLPAEVLVARKDGRDLAALLWVARGEMGLNIFHGRADGDVEGAPNLLHREMLEQASRRGVRLLHTGDAALPGETDPRILGITRFKESLGFAIHPAFQGSIALRPFSAGLRRRLLALRTGAGRRR